MHAAELHLLSIAVKKFVFNLLCYLQALSYLQTSDMKLLRLLLPNTRVFARVAPKQKVSVTDTHTPQGLGL